MFCSSIANGCNKNNNNNVQLLFKAKNFTLSKQSNINTIPTHPYIPGTLTVQCLSFCLLSVLTNYLYIASLRVLDCTVVTALFATNASFVYLLSWVILHQQFVGIRVTWRLTYETTDFVGYS